MPGHRSEDEMSTGVGQITGLRAGTHLPVPSAHPAGGGCSPTPHLPCSHPARKIVRGKPLPNYQAIRRNLPSSFSKLFFFASHCSHRRGGKRNQKTCWARSWQLLVECNTVGTKKTSLISTDIDRTASSVGLLPLHVYIFLLTRSGRNLQEVVWI